MFKVENPLIIDVEASGMGTMSYPIEVGVAMEDGKTYCTLIQPAPQWTYWDDDAERVHRVTRDILEAHGRPLPEVAAQLNTLFRGKILYSDGWVVDRPWLTTLFHAARTGMEFDVRPLERILSGQQLERWHATKDRLLEEMNMTRHRASNDAWIIQQTYRRTLLQAKP